MRKITLAAATVAALTIISGAARADSYYGPRQNGNQCWHSQGRWNSMGYWAPCQSAQGAQAARTTANGNANANARNGRKK
jgi:hypothetical protein